MDSKEPSILDLLSKVHHPASYKVKILSKKKENKNMKIMLKGLHLFIPRPIEILENQWDTVVKFKFKQSSVEWVVDRNSKSF